MTRATAQRQLGELVNAGVRPLHKGHPLPDHDEALAEERRAKAALRNLDKARKAAERKRREAQADERRAKRQRISELRGRERQLASEYRKAFNAACRLGRRVHWDEKEAEAWDHADGIQARLLGVIASRRHLQAELGSADTTERAA